MYSYHNVKSNVVLKNPQSTNFKVLTMDIDGCLVGGISKTLGWSPLLSAIDRGDETWQRDTYSRQSERLLKGVSGKLRKSPSFTQAFFCENLTETEKGEMGADTDSLAPDTKEMLTTVFRCNKKLILMRYSSWCDPGLAAFTLTLVSTPQKVWCSWQRFSLWCRAGQPHEIRWYYNF